VGDEYFRLFNSAGEQVAYNDDYCGLCSQITYVTTEGCQTYSLHEGCYEEGSCSGQTEITLSSVNGPLPVGNSSALEACATFSRLAVKQTHTGELTLDFLSTAEAAAPCGARCDCSVHWAEALLVKDVHGDQYSVVQRGEGPLSQPFVLADVASDMYYLFCLNVDTEGQVCSEYFHSTRSTASSSSSDNPQDGPTTAAAHPQSQAVAVSVAVLMSLLGTLLAIFGYFVYTRRVVVVDGLPDNFSRYKLMALLPVEKASASTGLQGEKGFWVEFASHESAGAALPLLRTALDAAGHSHATVRWMGLLEWVSRNAHSPPRTGSENPLDQSAGVKNPLMARGVNSSPTINF